jgi:hypothetical protein
MHEPLPASLISAAARGLVHRETQIRSGVLTVPEEVADKLGRDLDYVQKQRAAGSLYAVELNPDRVDEICRAQPDIMREVGVLLHFIEESRTLLYPTWQIREAKGQTELPLPGTDPLIYPEVALARKAYDAVVQRWQREGKLLGDPAPLTNDMLESYFAGKGDLSAFPLSEHIVLLDKAAERPLTQAQLERAWIYHLNPDGGYS